MKDVKVSVLYMLEDKHDFELQYKILTLASVVSNVTFVKHPTLQITEHHIL